MSGVWGFHRVCSSWRGPALRGGGVGASSPLLAFCPPAWAMAAPPCRKNANTSLCLSSFPPKRAVSLLICNFQLTRHQAPAQRLSQCAKEEKKNQPSNSGEDISF